MDVLKDLTPALIDAEAKDIFYKVSGNINFLLAPQIVDRPFTYKKKGWGQIERIEETQDGTATELRAPNQHRRTRRGESETRHENCWTFQTRKEHLILPWGSHFGILKKALFRSLEAQKKLQYESAPLGLMKVYPNWLDIGDTPADSAREGKIPAIVLTKRNTRVRSVMVEVFYDYIENRPFTTLIEVDSEAPIAEEKFVALFKSLNTLDTIGPAKRGSVTVQSIAKVNPSVNELKNLILADKVTPISDT